MNCNNEKITNILRDIRRLPAVPQLLTHVNEADEKKNE